MICTICERKTWSKRGFCAWCQRDLIKQAGDKEMGNELFLNKKARLLAEIKYRGMMKTSDVIRWGSLHYSNRADRDMRQLGEDGEVRRLTDEEKIQHKFGNIKEDVWAYVKNIFGQTMVAARENRV